ncbi:MAG: DNA internalization-related competence protein ComEC/Rec2 [Desulfobacteraceae bacterium]|jgi:competence protein ComEC
MFHRPILPVLLSFVCGILLGHKGLSPHQSLFLPLLLGIVSTLIFSLFISARFRFPCFLLVFLLVGILFDLNKHQDSELLPLANQRRWLGVEGTVLEPVKISGEMAKLVVNSDTLLFREETRKVREKLQVTIYNHPRDFAPGERIRFPARLRPFRNFHNPGHYDYELAMELRGFSSAASVSDGRRIVPMGRGHLGFPAEILERARRPIRNFFQKNLSPQNNALFRALILGERQRISPEQREPFNVAGLGHILAVSGLHIGLVGWLAYTIIKGLLSLSYRLTLRTDIRKLAAVVTCFPIVAYACLAGFQVSSQRAMIMALTYLFSMIVGRDKEIWSTFALAAFVVLAIDPHSLFGISFQLSFGAVIGILWLAPAIYSKIFAPVAEDMKRGRIIERLWTYFGGLIAVTLSAMIFLLPIISFYFHRISVVAIPANIIVVPILGLWVIPLGLLSVASLPISTTLAQLFLQLGAWGMEWMTAAVQVWTHFPWASFWVVTPSAFEMLIFYSLILFIFFIRRWSWAKWGLFVVLFLLAADISYWAYKTRYNPCLKVTYLDVGQGNAALIQFPGKKRMLIDGGGFSRSTFDVGRMVVAPFLFNSKILRVDYLVLTHPQADHMNGLRFIASHFHPKEFWYNGYGVRNHSFIELMRIVEGSKIRKRLPFHIRGVREISGVKVELFHPYSEESKELLLENAAGMNNSSLVLKLSYGGKSLLFPGDLERAGEEVVISRAGSLLRSDILLAPHHGSRYSCSKAFLQMVRPQTCIISSGHGNYFGFPHSETLKRLSSAGSQVLRIDQEGAVQLSLGPNRFDVRTFLRGPLKMR